MPSSMLSMVRMTVGRKIYALIGLSFIGLLGVAILDSRELASSLKQQKQIELQHLTELALGIIKEEHAATLNGGVAAADAQKQALARLAALRYGGNEYFFITDMQARVLMHAVSPQLVGKDMSDTKDANGKRLFVEMVETVRRSGSGFVDYLWPKPGSDQAQPKLSYVGGFGPWGWVVGTGVYVDDLAAQAWSSTQRSLIAAGLIVLLTLGVSMVVARGITGPLRRMTAP